jgi:hypothetical protein
MPVRGKFQQKQALGLTSARNCKQEWKDSGLKTTLQSVSCKVDQVNAQLGECTKCPFVLIAEEGMLNLASAQQVEVT